MRALIYTAWPVNAWRIPPEQVARLRATFPDIEFAQVMNAEEASREIPTIDVSLSPHLTVPMVESVTRLRWVHSSAAAVSDLLPLEALARHDIAVTNARGVQAVPMAEQVMAGLLALSRRLDLTLAAQRDRQWIQERLGDIDRPWLLQGKSMTIVGLGSIGAAIADRANAFGVRVTGVRRRPDQPKPASVDRVVGPDLLDDALRNADILVISAPFVESTTKLIDARRLALLAPGAVLVNVGRAQIVDTAAMIQALHRGQLGGAVLDVFDKEPLDTASPLWTMPNVVISPHSAGFRASHWEAVVDGFIANLGHFLRDEPLENRVDLEAGY